MSFSFWEKETFIGKIDYGIVGCGIVGLNTAINLKLKKPDARVVVFERGYLPHGASTRNAGFACIGSVSELLSDVQIMGEDAVFALVERRYQGLEKLKKRCGENEIQYKGLGGFEIFGVQDELNKDKCFDAVHEFNKKLNSITKTEKTYEKLETKSPFLGMKGIHAAIKNTVEGQLDTGKMMARLLKLAKDIGVIIFFGIEVVKIENEHEPCLILADGESINMRNLILCTNGFARELMPALEVIPARNQVWVTNPLPGLKIKGSFHYLEGYYYFRNVGERLLIGGGRHLDKDGETTSEQGETEIIQNGLRHMVEQIILPRTPYQVEYKWSGIMGLGPTKKPIIKAIDERTFVAVRMGGMGVAIGSLVAEEVTDLVLRHD
jgi:gamma-glutamylputrescine oxidase